MLAKRMHIENEPVWFWICGKYLPLRFETYVLLVSWEVTVKDVIDCQDYVRKLIQSTVPNAVKLIQSLELSCQEEESDILQGAFIFTGNFSDPGGKSKQYSFSKIVNKFHCKVEEAVKVWIVIFYGFYFYKAESSELLNYKFFLVMSLNINLSLLYSSFKWITHCLPPFYISLLFVMHSWGHETQSMLRSSSTDLSHRQEGSCFKYTVDYWEPSPCLHPTPHLCSSDS